MYLFLFFKKTLKKFNTDNKKNESVINSIPLDTNKKKLRETSLLECCRTRWCRKKDSSHRRNRVKICSCPVEMVPLKVSKEIQHVTKKRRIRIKKKEIVATEIVIAWQNTEIYYAPCVISAIAIPSNSSDIRETNNNYAVPRIFIGILWSFFSLYFKLGSSTRVFGIQAQFIFKFRTYLSRD